MAVGWAQHSCMCAWLVGEKYEGVGASVGTSTSSTLAFVHLGTIFSVGVFYSGEKAIHYDCLQRTM